MRGYKTKYSGVSHSQDTQSCADVGCERRPMAKRLTYYLTPYALPGWDRVGLGTTATINCGQVLIYNLTSTPELTHLGRASAGRKNACVYAVARSQCGLGKVALALYKCMRQP